MTIIYIIALIFCIILYFYPNINKLFNKQNKQVIRKGRNMLFMYSVVLKENKKVSYLDLETQETIFDERLKETIITPPTPILGPNEEIVKNKIIKELDQETSDIYFKKNNSKNKEVDIIIVPFEY